MTARQLAAKRTRGLCIRKITIFLLMLLSAVPAKAQATPRELATFLRERIGLTAKELVEVSRGAVVAEVLRSEAQEVAVFGIALVKAPADFFLECFRDIESYKKGTSVPQVKMFSTPPRIEDV